MSGNLDSLFADFALPLRVDSQRQVIKADHSTRQSAQHIREAELDGLIAVGDLAEVCPGCPRAIRERLALRQREPEEELAEVHTRSLPAGAFMSTLEVNTHVYRWVMDIDQLYEARLGAFKALLRDRFHRVQKDLAEAAGIAPTTISRILNGTKNIGDELALRLETKLELEPGAVVYPWSEGWADERAAVSEEPPLPEPLDVMLSRLPKHVQESRYWRCYQVLTERIQHAGDMSPSPLPTDTLSHSQDTPRDTPPGPSSDRHSAGNRPPAKAAARSPSVRRSQRREE
jgi:transcriptional regulator with XRE-family HTH domain